jgi:hypothetical protein
VGWGAVGGGGGGGVGGAAGGGGRPPPHPAGCWVILVVVVVVGSGICVGQEQVSVVLWAFRPSRLFVDGAR